MKNSPNNSTQPAKIKIEEQTKRHQTGGVLLLAD
jgi:hypothetical protein